MMKRTVSPASAALCAGWLLLAAATQAPSCRAAAPLDASPLQPVAVDFFFEPGCKDCARVREEVLPELDARFGATFAIRERDLGIETNYLALLACMDRLGVKENAPVYMLVDGAQLLAGFDPIATNLAACIEGQLAARLSASAPPPPPSPAPGESDVLSARMRSFTIGSVLFAGLIDGINPCAFSTLVFLISVLSMAGTVGRRLLLIGAVFCLASFLTYTAIGLGLLRALHTLAYFRLLQKIVDRLLIVLLLGLSLFSFRDALRFHRTHHAKDVSLQLPDGIKRLIHRLLRTGFGSGAQVASAFVVGAAVTGLESVCTGQVYVPTLALIVKSGNDAGRGIGFLLLYNLMFILPLVVVFLLTYRGLKLAQLLSWSARNVVVSKILLGLLFLALAGVILSFR